MRAARVAYFPDSFHEVNGVAHTSRNFVAYAMRRELPLLCVRAGTRAEAVDEAGTVRSLELGRSRASVRLEKDLKFDAVFWRHCDEIALELERFRPDVIHVTGPSELGLMGAYFAGRLEIPLAASWHTNLHEYAGRRMGWLRPHLPPRSMAVAQRSVEASTLWLTAQLYRRAAVLFAPNRELCAMLERVTGRRGNLMQRGVDTELFTPERRTRRANDGRLVLGYVGRLSIEKNVALLARVERELAARGVRGVEFVIAGHGGEEAALRRALVRAKFAGVLRGEALATAYADMDLLVFPSHTDTFGNVVLEALASGVPAVVTPDGGPKYIVDDGVTGVVAEDDGFSAAIAAVAQSPARLREMRAAARTYALGCSWDAVFDRVYAGYETVLQDCKGDAASQ